MSKHTVVVGNIGCVLRDGTFTEARDAFVEYRRKSRQHYGRCAGESVVWFKDGEIYMENKPRKKPCED